MERKGVLLGVHNNFLYYSFFFFLYYSFNTTKRGKKISNVTKRGKIIIYITWDHL